jgi:hypothetical protein
MDIIQDFTSMVAMEGVISKFRNRHVSQKQYANAAGKTHYANINAMIQDLINNGETDSSGWKVVDGYCEGLSITLNADKDLDTITPEHQRAIKTVFSSIGQAQKMLAEMIVKEYNDSQGKNGPWVWTESGAEFSPKKASDVTSKIKLEGVDIRIHSKEGIYHADGIAADFYFDDGDLWWGHCIILHDIADPKSGRLTVTDKTEYEIAG